MTATALLAMDPLASDVLAHGLGGRTDLPIPLSLALYGAATAVIVSFAALGVLWPTPKIVDRPGRPLGGLTGLVDSPAFRTTLQAIALVLTAAVVYVAFAGPPDSSDNLAPWLLYITFWVGLIPVSVLLGPVWAVVNPLRLLHGLGTRFAGGDRTYPDWLGYWPAAGWLAVFVWVELVLPGRDDPRLVGSFIVLYAVANLYAAALTGEKWFARGDGFAVYSLLLGRLSPFGRRDDGRIALRNPLHGLATIQPEPGLVAVIAVLIGSTGFDGLTRTAFWRDNIDPNSTVMGTLGLLAMIVIAAALYQLGARAAGWLTRSDAGPLPGVFASSLVPIALGYAVAHYFSLFMLEGQRPLALVSDPLGNGADWFGSADRAIDYFLSTDLTAYIQIGAIVVGHILGVIVAHERAVASFRGRQAVTSQYPLLAVMVLFTLGGVSLLVSA